MYYTKQQLIDDSQFPVNSMADVNKIINDKAILGSSSLPSWCALWKMKGGNDKETSTEFPNGRPELFFPTIAELLAYVPS